MKANEVEIYQENSFLDDISDSIIIADHEKILYMNI